MLNRAKRLKQLPGRLVHAVTDAFGVSRAFDQAAHSRYSEALRTLQCLHDDAKDSYEVRLLKGALYSHLNKHELAIEELTLAAKVVRTSKQLSKAEANYLVAYAVQYWEWSARQIDMHMRSPDVSDALRVESPIVLGQTRAHLRRKFPLKVEFIDIEIVD